VAGVALSAPRFALGLAAPTFSHCHYRWPFATQHAHRTHNARCASLRALMVGNAVDKEPKSNVVWELQVFLSISSVQRNAQNAASLNPGAATEMFSSSPSADLKLDAATRKTPRRHCAPRPQGGLLMKLRTIALAGTILLGTAAMGYAQSSSTIGAGGSSAGGGSTSTTLGTGGSSAGGSGSGSASTLGVGGATAGNGSTSTSLGTGGSAAGGGSGSGSASTLGAGGATAGKGSTSTSMGTGGSAAGSGSGSGSASTLGAGGSTAGKGSTSSTMGTGASSAGTSGMNAGEEHGKHKDHKKHD
jgi:hypothetical protein